MPCDVDVVYMYHVIAVDEPLYSCNFGVCYTVGELLYCVVCVNYASVCTYLLHFKGFMDRFGK